MSHAAVLIVAQAQPWRASLAERLASAGCRVELVDVADAAERAESFRPDIVFVSEPGGERDPLEVCRLIRRRLASRTPAFLLTSDEPSSDDDGSLGGTRRLSALAPLAEAVGLLIDGSCDAPPGPPRPAPQIEVNWSERRALVNGRELSLTPTELRLLDLLAQRPGHAFGRHELAAALVTNGRRIQERTIDVHVKALRHKLGPHGEAIETVRGFGYRLRRPEKTNASEDAPSSAAGR
jgi:DNA-binding response OmpR family regulator